jgi:TonB family protein
MRTMALVSSLLFALGASGCGGAPPSSGSAGPNSSKEMEAGPRGEGSAPTGGLSGDKNAAEEQATGEGGSRGPGAPPPPKPINSPGEPDKTKAPQQAVVDSGSAPLAGRLTQQEIGEILSKNAALFNDCYTIGAGKSQSFTGVVTVRATLGPSGSVTDAQVTKSTAKNQKVDTCVVQAFKKIKFPPPKNGGTSVITFPMEFDGVEQVK